MSVLASVAGLPPPTDRFTMVRNEPFEAYCGERGIRGHPMNTLLRIALKADWRTGAIRGFSLTEYAGILGFGAQSGRRTLKAHLDALADAGAVQYSAPAGRPWGGNGVLILVDYDRYVRRDLSKTRPAPALTARKEPDKEVPNRAVITQLDARRSRGYGTENRPSLGSLPIGRPLSQTTEIDPLPVPTEHPRPSRRTPERGGVTRPTKATTEAASSGSELLAEVQAQLGVNIYGEPRRRFEALRASSPALMPKLVEQLRAMKGTRSIKLVLERLEEFALAESERSQRAQAARAAQDRHTRIQSATRELDRTIGELVRAGHEVDLPLLLAQTAAHFDVAGDEEAQLLELARQTERDARFSLVGGPQKAMGQWRATLLKPEKPCPAEEPRPQEPHSTAHRLVAAVSWCSKDQLRHAGDLAYVWVKAGRATDRTALLIEKAVNRDPEFFPPGLAEGSYQGLESRSP